MAFDALNRYLYNQNQGQVGGMHRALSPAAPATPAAWSPVPDTFTGIIPGFSTDASGALIPAGTVPSAPVANKSLGNPNGVDPSILPSSITAWTGPAPDAQSLILNNPNYKQQLEWLSDAYGLQNQGFDLAGNRIASGYNVSHAGVDAAAANAALSKEEAGHQHVQNIQRIRESLASRGLLAQNGDPFSVGQNQVDQGEESYNYNDSLKRIEMSVQAANAAYSDAMTQASNAKSLAEMDLALQRASAAQQYARDKGQALMGTASDLQQQGAFNRPATEAFYVASAGAYQTLDGKWYDVNGNPIAGPASAAAPASQPAATPPATQPAPQAPGTPPVYQPGQIVGPGQSYAY